MGGGLFHSNTGGADLFSRQSSIKKKDKGPKYGLSPVTRLQGEKELTEAKKADNMLPVVDSKHSLVSLRSMVVQDFEPSHFLQLFGGTFVILTHDYLKFPPNEGGGKPRPTMLFQLLGTPYLN